MIFQTESEIVRKCYQDNPNYLIEHTVETSPVKTCAVYFSSHNLYFPNAPDIFQRRIVQNNHFEWYKNHYPDACKHIFIRDIQKQWYLEGINAKINSPEKLLEWLKVECSGYRIVTVGSSAGGYAALLYGYLLNADRAFSFNGQFDLTDRLTDSTAEVDPLVFQHQNDLKKWYQLDKILGRNPNFYHFHSLYSAWDKQQLQSISPGKITVIPFLCSKHGIPFLKSNLNSVFLKSDKALQHEAKSVHHFFTYSLKNVGIVNTAQALSKELLRTIKRKS